MSVPVVSTPLETVEDLEVELLLEAIFRQYGFDFRGYARASLRRRVWNMVKQEGCETISRLQDRVLHDPAYMEKLLLHLSVTVTSMFRDPGFYLSFREQVVPVLKSYPFIRIWHAGCATGEEVYSMAVLLSEEGIYDRCRIYATDMNEHVLRKAKDGIFPADAMVEYGGNYLRAGGKSSLTEYYTAQYQSAIFRQSLKKNIVFSHHNLVSDGSFNEFNVILCRNVMIYFAGQLQNRVHNLMFDSLHRFGVLCLGSKESIKGSPHENDYEELDAKERIYRRVA